MYHTLAKVRLALGETESAISLLREGQQRLIHQASAITRIEVKRDVLYKLEENAELLSLAAAHQIPPPAL